MSARSGKRKRRNSDKRTPLPFNIKKSIDLLFERKFSYDSKDPDSCESNEPAAPFQFSGQLQESWQIHKYLSFKDELNSLKNNLNDKNMLSWHEHTRQVNLGGSIAPEIRHHFRPELCTQAWCKFYEIASTYLDVDLTLPYFSVHLCEAPGAFVTSLNQFLFTKGFKSQWRWLASTLNPYYEGNDVGQMIDDDRFIRCSLDNWYFGVDGTGNLMSHDNLRGLCDLLADCSVDLVTADGSVDCQWNPAEQENVVSRLQYCEMLTALHILSPGGTFILKMFTLLECQSICLIYSLNCVFKKVHVFKPCTSKGGNSEVYVICKGYKGKSEITAFLETVTPLYFGPKNVEGCLFAQDDIPEPFFLQHDRCTEFFKDCQMTSIQRNLDLYKDSDLQSDLCSERSNLSSQKDYCLECFFNHYEVQPLESAARLMKMNKGSGRRDKSSAQAQFAEKVILEGKFTGSFQERQRLLTLPWKQRVLDYETYEEEVDCEDNSLWIQCMAGGITETQAEELHMQRGRPLHRIAGSHFCHGFYVHRMLEIIDNVQWIKDYVNVDPKFIKKVVDGLVASLITATDLVNRPKMDPPKQNNTDPGHGTKLEQVCNAASMEADNNGCHGDGVTEAHSLVTNTADKTHEDINPKFSCAIKTKLSLVLHSLSEKCPSTSSDRPCVPMYSAVSEGVTERFELTSQGQLCEAVLDILKTSREGDTVLLELETSVTRVTAGLIYCLYRTFSEIGFIHNHGNLLRRHLVCVSFKHCPINLRQYLEACHQQILNTQSDAVLEIVPISILLQDSDFTSFLHISNSSLLKSAITSTISKERQTTEEAS